MAPDLKELLRDAAAPPARPLDLDDVRRRASDVARGRLLRTTAAGVAVVMVLVGAAVPLLRQLDDSTVEFTDTPPTPSGSVSEASTVPPGPTESRLWEPIPEAPIAPRVRAATVWTGTEMLVWGGHDPAGAYRALADGAAYNPETKTWRLLPEAPIQPNTSVSAVWTGRAMVAWVPQRNQQSALSYDPARDEWTVLPAPPSVVLKGVSTVWTGTEMIVWAGHDQDGEAQRGGFAYEPGAERWREVATAPIAPRFRSGAVWTGAEMIVWGGDSGDGAVGTHHGDGAAYDPATDSWRRIAAAPLPPRDPGGVLWNGREMVVLGGYTGDNGVPARDGASYDVEGDVWTQLPDIPVRGLTEFAVAGDAIVAWRGGDPDPHAFSAPGRWAPMPWEGGQLGRDAAIGATGRQLFIWGGETASGEPVTDGIMLRTGPPGDDAMQKGAPPPPMVEGQASSPPEDAPEEADVLQVWPQSGSSGPWREDPTETAETFGREVLRWRDARVADGEPAEDGSFGERLTLTSDEVGRSVDMVVVPVADGSWVVTSVGGPTMGGLSVSINQTRVMVATGWFGGAATATAELLVQYPDHGAQATVSQRPAEFETDLSVPPTKAGSVLILFRDQQGQVIGAIGTGVPAGDFAAS